MSTDELLAARQSTHGEYLDHARVTQSQLDVLMSGPNWDALPMAMKESLHMFCHKQGRVVVGDPYEPDHWADIAGYARLIEQRLRDGRLRRLGASSPPAGGEEAYRGVEPLVPRREPTGPGTPDDGGHYENQADADEDTDKLDARDIGTINPAAPLAPPTGKNPGFGVGTKVFDPRDKLWGVVEAEDDQFVDVNLSGRGRQKYHWTRLEHANTEEECVPRRAQVGDVVKFAQGTVNSTWQRGGAVEAVQGNLVSVRWPGGELRHYHWSMLFPDEAGPLKLGDEVRYVGSREDLRAHGTGTLGAIDSGVAYVASGAVTWSAPLGMLARAG